MVKGLAIVLAATLGLCSCSYMIHDESEEEISLAQCPAPVKATIEKEAKGGTIEEIEKETENGKVIYEAEIVVGGKAYEIRVAPDGKLLSKELDD